LRYYALKDTGHQKQEWNGMRIGINVKMQMINMTQLNSA
jgi:hypothetical protein